MSINCAICGNDFFRCPCGVRLKQPSPGPPSDEEPQLPLDDELIQELNFSDFDNLDLEDGSEDRSFTPSNWPDDDSEVPATEKEIMQELGLIDLYYPVVG